MPSNRLIHLSVAGFVSAAVAAGAFAADLEFTVDRRSCGDPARPHAGAEFTSRWVDSSRLVVEIRTHETGSSFIDEKGSSVAVDRNTIRLSYRVRYPKLDPDQVLRCVFPVRLRFSVSGLTRAQNRVIVDRIETSHDGRINAQTTTYDVQVR